MKKSHSVVITIALSLILVGFFSCDTGSSSTNENPPENQDPTPEDPTRSFYMGFTPWPYRVDSDYAEILYNYDLIQQHGDMVGHHFQQGIPWPEAFAMSDNPVLASLPNNIQDEVGLRTSQTDVVTRIYLAVDCLNGSRDALAGYYGEDYDGNGSTEQQPRPNNSSATPDIAGYTNGLNWSSLGFTDLEIAQAFVSYSVALIEAFKSAGFDVAYYNYASEITDLKLHNAAAYNDFISFAKHVYTELKLLYPDMTILFSAALKHPDSQDRITMQNGILTETNGTEGPVIEYTDMLGISVYPYAFFHPAVSDDPAEQDNGLTDLPAAWASQITAMASGKPVAFTETGWIAQDLSIANYGLTRYSSEANQRRFLELLFAQANELNAEFILWFSLVDYSHFWTNVLTDDVSAIWRDLGLLDYDGTTNITIEQLSDVSLSTAGLTERRAFQAWQDWLSRTISNS